MFTRFNSLLLFIFLASTQVCYAAAADEPIPADVLRAEARFIQRVNLDPSLPRTKDFSKKYLFHREGTCPQSKQNKVESKNVYKAISMKKLPIIDFNKRVLVPFDDRGTCSAMALDFAARYNTACANNPDPEARKKCVEGFAPFYTHSNSTFMSRQAAYNTIEVKSYDYEQTLERKDLSDEIKRQKINSLANYHKLTLEPVTETIVTDDIVEHMDEFLSTINDLPNGTYVVRMLHPGPTVKHEYYGHTMVFVIDDEFSIYYDNGSGATDITSNPALGVHEVLTDWHIPEFRIYRAFCPQGGCINFANDSCSVN